MLSRLAAAWFARHRSYESALLVLTALFVGVVATTVADEVRGLAQGSALWVSTLAVALGWRLARSRRPLWLLAGTPVAAGLGVVLLFPGRLIVPLARLGRDLTAALVLGLPPWRDPALAASLETLRASGTAIVGRVSNWLLSFPSGPIFDPLVVSLLWAMLLWALALWGGWVARRRDGTLAALVPAFALQFALFAFTGRPTTGLVPTLALLLAILGLAAHHRREQRWAREQWEIVETIRVEVATGSTIVALLLLGLALLIPSLSLEPVARAVTRRLEGSMEVSLPVAAALGVEPRERVGALEPWRLGGLPRNQLIGSGPELSDVPVMEVEWDQTGGPRPYWRGLTYDRYTGRGWLTSSTRERAVEGGVALPVRTEGSIPRLQTIYPAPDRGALMYVDGELLGADRPLVAAYRSNDDLFGATTIEGGPYRASSLRAAPSAARLRAAGSRYPEPVRARYLILPEGISDRVINRAIEVTAPHRTPYDQARAIEAHLRTFPYTLDLPAPPAGAEIADFFLFELQRGYCDYYATTMIVMARSVGIPARLAVGYVAGRYDDARGRYVVTEFEAHSWAELYFPGVGWVPFEPTAAQPRSEPGASDPAPAAMPAVPTPAPGVLMPLRQPALRLAALLLPALLLFIWFRERRLLAGAPGALLMSRLYARIHGHARRLGAIDGAGYTPYELAGGLAARLAAIDARRQRRLLAPARDELEGLVALYVQSSFGGHSPDEGTRRLALRRWSRLRRRLWLARLLALRSRPSLDHEESSGED